WVQLQRAAEVLAERMRAVPGTRDIDSGHLRGREQVNLTLKPEARALGLRERDLAQQARAAFFGVEAVRQQRERDEMRVYARLPEAERRMEYSLENLLIRTPGGGEIPLAQAAVLERDRSQTSLQRHGGRRAITVSADTDPRIAIPTDVARTMEAELLPPLVAEFPGLEWQVAGQEEDMRDALGVLALGFAIAALVMYALMAIVFRSYLQPLLIVSAIPFGIAGAILGHVVMGFDLSMISMFGIVALAGVVVNDSLVLVYLINTLRRQGMERTEAVLAGLQRRFRPILLTSITAFLGLAPMIFETSIQARMLIPMAISLGFGVLFVTPIALIVLPAMLLILEDAIDLARRPWSRRRAGA
ncbi:MAG: efflux RND transporter permease subunit, partial [Pseudomonadales bacterium]